MSFEMHAFICWSGDPSVGIPSYSLEWNLGVEEGEYDLLPDERENIRRKLTDINYLLSGETPDVYFSDECGGCGKTMINRICNICERPYDE